MNIRVKSITTWARMLCAFVLLVGLAVLPQKKAAGLVNHFKVNTVTDAWDSTITGGSSGYADGICDIGDGHCSLRAAISEASFVSDGSNPVTIDFDASLNGATLVLSLGRLNWTRDYITITGFGRNITISGAGLPVGVSIMRISGSNNVLQDLSISASPLQGIEIGRSPVYGGYASYNVLQYLNVIGSNQSGILITEYESGSDYNEIRNSFIGGTSTTIACGTSLSNGYAGIQIDGGANDTIIEGNRIVCSGYAGIYMAANGVGSSSNVTIDGNSIGTDGAHTGMGNYDGIVDSSGSSTVIQNNIISGNTYDGIYLYHTTGTRVFDNKIGTNTAGMLAIPNGENGIHLTSTTSGVEIGSATDAGKRNIISGNGHNGVLIDGASENNVLNGNYIGLGADGSGFVSNGYAGVAIESADHNTITSDGSSTVPQFISGNAREGVYVLDSQETYFNQNVFIGTAADMVTPRSNGHEGIKLDTGTTLSRIYSNIAYNNMAGIALVGDSTMNNYLRPVFVGRNGGLPIDLGNDGHSANGTHLPPGPNNWQNYPTPVSTTADGFYGQTCTSCIVHVYEAINNPIQALGGGELLGTTNPDPVTGIIYYTIPADVAAVTMVACNMPAFNCSEMSPKVLNPAWHYVYLPLIKK